MPLNPATLATEIYKFSSEQAPGFVAYPASAQEAAEKWADAFIAFLGEAVQPPGLVAAVQAGRSLMISTMMAQTAVDPGSGMLIFPTGAGLLALGNGVTAMVALVATPAFTPPPAIAVPPPAPFVPPALPPTMDPITPPLTLAITALAWAITGTFTAGPPVPPTPWV